MWRTLLLASVLPFVSAFLGGALAFSLVAAPQATAQSSQLQEVRASAFTLVGPDGTVLAQLAHNPASGTGRLSMRDATGTERVGLTGGGSLQVYDENGTMVFRAGRSAFAAGPTSGLPPVNGVELGPGGSIRMLEAPPR